MGFAALSTQKLDTLKLVQNSIMKQKNESRKRFSFFEVGVVSKFWKRNCFSAVLYAEILAIVLVLGI